MKLYQVDAFTDKPFRGNPAAVCFCDRPLSPALMQSIAAEMNLSETAFLLEENETWRLRWFTPLMEVSLCGHATLAAAAVLFHLGLAEGEVAFHTKSGVLTATKKSKGICLNFPAAMPVAVTVPDFAKKAFGLDFIYCGQNEYMDLVLEVEDPALVVAARPNLSLFPPIDKAASVILCASSTGDYDLVSRVFSPADGIDEDPVTGSAHCATIPYFAKKLGKTTIKAYQASKRGGALLCTVENGRVLLEGEAVIVLSGDLHLPRTDWA